MAHEGWCFLLLFINLHEADRHKPRGLSNVSHLQFTPLQMFFCHSVQQSADRYFKLSWQCCVSTIFMIQDSGQWVPAQGNIDIRYRQIHTGDNWTFSN